MTLYTEIGIKRVDGGDKNTLLLGCCLLLKVKYEFSCLCVCVCVWKMEGALRGNNIGQFIRHKRYYSITNAAFTWIQADDRRQTGYPFSGQEQNGKIRRGRQRTPVMVDGMTVQS